MDVLIVIISHHPELRTPRVPPSVSPLRFDAPSNLWPTPAYACRLDTLPGWGLARGETRCTGMFSPGANDLTGATHDVKAKSTVAARSTREALKKGAMVTARRVWFNR